MGNAEILKLIKKPQALGIKLALCLCVLVTNNSRSGWDEGVGEDRKGGDAACLSGSLPSDERECAIQ